VERVVLIALATNGLAGKFGIVFREADPPNERAVSSGV